MTAPCRPFDLASVRGPRFPLFHRMPDRRGYARATIGHRVWVVVHPTRTRTDTKRNYALTGVSLSVAWMPGHCDVLVVRTEGLRGSVDCAVPLSQIRYLEDRST